MRWTPYSMVLVPAILTGCVVQIILAKKKSKHTIGMIIPLLFLMEGIRFWIGIWGHQLIIRIWPYMMSPIFLMSLFELVYWRQCWQDICREKEQPKGGEEHAV